jgi:hypothetical protein
MCEHGFEPNSWALGFGVFLFIAFHGRCPDRPLGEPNLWRTYLDRAVSRC